MESVHPYANPGEIMHPRFFQGRRKRGKNEEDEGKKKNESRWMVRGTETTVGGRGGLEEKNE